jgi:hypothetical protein
MFGQISDSVKQIIPVKRVRTTYSYMSNIHTSTEKWVTQKGGGGEGCFLDGGFRGKGRVRFGLLGTGVLLGWWIWEGLIKGQHHEFFYLRFFVNKHLPCLLVYSRTI